MTTEISTKEQVLEQTLDKFWETVPPLWNNIRSHIRTLATENFDISVEQFHILRNIRRGHWSVSELAEAKSISRPAISQGVDVLVTKGLVSRRQSQEDRRYVQLELTSEGNALLDSIFQDTRGWMRTKLDPLSSDELNTAIQGLEILKKMMEPPA